MAKQDKTITKKPRGRPATGLGILIGVRLQPDVLKALDRFIEDRETEMTRPEAIRRFVELGLKVQPKP